MSSNRNIIPFNPPHLMTARRKAGFVDVSSSTVAAHNKNKNKNNNDNDDASSSEEVTGYFHRGWDNAAIAGAYSTAISVAAAALTTATEATATTPSPLERNETISGRIIEITTTPSSSPSSSGINDDDDAKQPSVIEFWLQRKLGHQSSSHGLVVRLGYKLRASKKQKKVSEGNDDDSDDGDDQNNDCRWELDTDESGRHILVRVHILHNNNSSSTVLQQSSNNNNNNHCRQNSVQFMDLDSPLNELSALQMIARHTKTAQAQAIHVAGTNLIATSEENRNIYTILPYYRDGTLLQFCQSIGSLEEPLARFIFRQIVQVRNNDLDTAI